MATYKSQRTRFPSMQDIENELGGVEGLYTLFSLHYCKMWENPRMVVLFDSRHPDTNVSAYEHAKRISAVLISRCLRDKSYWDALDRDYDYGTSTNRSHKRAKKCPMRP